MLMHLLLAGAFAQDGEPELPVLNAQLYRLPIDAGYTMWTDDSGYKPDGYFAGRLALGYVNEPFVFVWDDSSERVSLVSNALGLNAIGMVSYSRVRFALDVPVYLVAMGEVQSGGGLGDIALDVKGSALDHEEYPVGLAFGVRLIAPTATVRVPLQNNGFGYEIQAIVDKPFDDFLVAANIGTRGLPQAVMDNVEINDQFFFRAGGGYRVTDASGASLDLVGNFTYADIGNNAANPIEAMLGGWTRVDEDWVLRGGVGTGLTPGIGSPVARVVLAIGYEPPADSDTDLDGIMDSVDGCITEPEDPDDFEDADGCPELDNDGDGIVDASDTCPLVAEDADGWKDDDGCPDLTTQVHVFITDVQSGKPIIGAAATVNSETVREIGDDDFVLDLPAGSYQISAAAEKYLPLKEAFVVVDGAPQEFRYQMQKDVAPGIVSLKVTDPAKKAIAATWAINDNPPETVTAGKASTSLPPGDYVVMVRAEGYVPASFPVAVKEGATSTLEVVLQPAKVKVTREKLDIKDKIFFDTGKATIQSKSFGLLDEVAGIMLDRPDIVMMRIEGHTDERGNDETNMKLSNDRAAAVMKYLVDKGIEASRLSSKGYGESKPVDPASNAAAWEKNRRVEFFIEKWADE